MYLFFKSNPVFLIMTQIILTIIYSDTDKHQFVNKSGQCKFQTTLTPIFPIEYESKMLKVTFLYIVHVP